VTSGIIPESILQLPPSNIGSGIDIDGNMVVDGGRRDWVSLPNTVFSCSSNPRVGCDVDLATGKNDNSFGQGTKEDTEDPTVVSGSIPNNKSDLRRFYVASERVGSANLLYLAWSRVQEPNGTTNMDFELNHSTEKYADGVPKRTVGDVLVRYDLAQGGTVPNLGYQRWITSGSSSNCEASNSVPCWGKLTPLTNNVQGAINPAQITEPFAGGFLTARTFGEASVNLQASGIFAAGTCDVFGQAYLKSRSSDAFTSELKDFILPIPVSITNCAPALLDNTAWASATNFTPTGGVLGGSISDQGHIKVTANQSASLNVAPTGRDLAVSFGSEPTIGIAGALDQLDASVIHDALRASESGVDFAKQLGLSEHLEQSPSVIATHDGSGTSRPATRVREIPSRSVQTVPRAVPNVRRTVAT